MDDALSLLKMEMENEEIHLRVNAIHRLKTVIYCIGNQRTVSELIPYIKSLVSGKEGHAELIEDDEVLFAIAEEIGKIYDLLDDKTTFIDILKDLARASETVVREEATKTLELISKKLSTSEIQNTFAQMVISLG